MGKQIMTIIENFGMLVSPEADINTAEAKSIIYSSRTKMEIAENAYLFGLIKGMESSHRQMIPIYSLHQITDAEWQAMARKNKLEREVLM